MIKSIMLALFITFAFTGVCFSADVTIGLISEVKGKAIVVRDGQEHVPEAGFKLKISDTLNTGPEAAIGVIFNDETVLSIGENSELVVNEYVFNPDQSRFSFVVRMVRGTAAYMSGLIAKISPESARFITPSASIGIRGTKMVIQVENDK
ncbi:MAG: FecR domain-containing protein [Deltaproteobacteria bacterium]|nr:FecR domain-containing protein [Deltaproteobacteria bacterium]